MSARAGMPLLDRLTALADGTRCRILLLLARHELTVSELCTVLRLPQSTVSRHLKVLTDGAWVRTRPEGTRRRYSLPLAELDAVSRGLWDLAKEQAAAAADAREDGRRLSSVLAQQRRRSRRFFLSAAGRWDRLRDELFGPQVHGRALFALLPEDWVVGDLGCGTGPVAQALAPFVARVVSVDDSTAMLDAARERLQGIANVELREGELEALPLPDRSLDAATLILVLHHLPDPAKVLAQVARVLRPGGRVLIVDMLPHDREDYRRDMGHVWLGFAEGQLRDWLEAVGLQPQVFRPLAPDPEARGPELFSLAATRQVAARGVARRSSSPSGSTLRERSRR
jgi:ArsR family transcriptional regulator